MPITLMPLPYEIDALEPTVSVDTLQVHHGKHHKAYVDKTNELIAGTDLDDATLEEIIAAADKDGHTKLFNQAAQVWNHGFYWVSIAPAQRRLSSDLTAAIDAAFGSKKDMIAKMVGDGVGHFGSGWIWLVAKGDKVELETTHDAAQPSGKNARPLLVVDLWEHAYYLDRKNERKAYLEAIADKLDWGFASDNFAAETRWTYPA